MSIKPKYEELETKLVATEAKLAELQRLLKIAIDRITALEERVNKNSSNSSKPPSADRKPDSRGKNGSRKHRSEGYKCPCCGSGNLSAEGEPLVLQQVDLPEVKATVTQFDCTKHRCASCGENYFADLPSGITNSAFGPRLMALIATFTGVFHLSKRDAIQLVRDLYGIEILDGSIVNVEERVVSALLLNFLQ